MRKRFEQTLATLHNEMIEMGSMIENSIEKAIKALVNNDVALAQEIIEGDAVINNQEREIETLCMKLLLQEQPVASDLREVSAALKMVTDMERIGDHAADISEIISFMGQEDYINKCQDIQDMARETMVMLVKSIEAFVEKNQGKAEDVIKKDDTIDDLFNKARADIIKMIRDNEIDGEVATDLLMIAKYFERIGDHATNIAEWVIYSITGVHKSEN